MMVSLAIESESCWLTVLYDGFRAIVAFVGYCSQALWHDSDLLVYILSIIGMRADVSCDLRSASRSKRSDVSLMALEPTQGACVRLSMLHDGSVVEDVSTCDIDIVPTASSVCGCTRMQRRQWT